MDVPEEAYIVACGTMLAREGDSEYAARAAKPAEESGLTLIAGGRLGDKVEILEGQLPEGTEFMAIERFPSIESLRGFWHSQEYQKAIPFREKSVKVHFIVALEGVTSTELGKEPAETAEK